jgi:hypothetical protein
VDRGRRLAVRRSRHPIRIRPHRALSQPARLAEAVKPSCPSSLIRWMTFELRGEGFGRMVSRGALDAAGTQRGCAPPRTADSSDIDRGATLSFSAPARAPARDRTRCPGCLASANLPASTPARLPSLVQRQTATNPPLKLSGAGRRGAAARASSAL